jgi:isopentenyl phosphate kinase
MTGYIFNAMNNPQSAIRNQKSEIVFLKLGGSLITNKTRVEHACVQIIHRLAREIKAARAARPDLKIVLGHGSGSFGHVAAKKYGTRDGITDVIGWIGFAKVAASAARLNQIVTDIFIEEDVPVISLPPSASARCENGTLIHLDTNGVQSALSHNLVPLVQGDVALDSVRGATIISTEDVFGYLIDDFKPTRILLCGEVNGVYADASMQGPIIKVITPANLDRYRSALGGSHGTDVTGGMIGKVQQMIELVKQQPAIKVRIFSGVPSDNVQRALIDPQAKIGTLIKYE